MTGLNVSLDHLLQQESDLQFANFTFEDGVDIGCRLLQKAREEPLPVVIDVFAYGQQLFHAAMPGTRPDNGEWVARKRRAVLRFAHSSFYLGRLMHANGTTLDAKYFLPPLQYCDHGGSFPILLKQGGVIGAVTVSGLAQQDDHTMVVDMLTDFLADR